MIEAAQRHQVTRVRHESARRPCTVTAIERLSPHMLRVHLRSPQLVGFASAAPDDHVKLIVPATPAATDAKDGLCARDYTPRAFDADAGTLTIDFALHEAGPATAWALGAKVGDMVTVGGPRGSKVVPDDFDWYLLVGDETALPAIGRRLEELRPEVPVTIVALVDGEADRLPLAARAGLDLRWVSRDGSADDAALLGRALGEVTLPRGEGFVWIAAEAGVAKALRSQVVDAMHHPREWTKASGYWSAGRPGEHKSIED